MRKQSLVQYRIGMQMEKLVEKVTGVRGDRIWCGERRGVSGAIMVGGKYSFS